MIAAPADREIGDKMRVLLVDDHPLFLTGIKTVVAELDASVEMQEALTIEAAMTAAERGAFDLALLDLNMPGVTGLDALRLLKPRLASAAVAVVSGSDLDKDVRDALELGAAGYIPKTHGQAEMMRALKEVLEKGIYVPPSVRTAVDPLREEISLTERQMDVLQGLLQGKPNKVIARNLDVAEGTVKAHLESIYQKLHVNSRLQAMSRAYALGLVDKFKKVQ
jgi:DNA-binding NarL/FixJ family response regulator